ncbi:hypothetical protein [Nocardia higoensis]|uniref:hypothetical protein n=1 Tax=Nocardia higoensis TaxID=228599 RepID=UPI0002D497FB|nr:hypothetical protein [Nocardia higoensis]
MDQVEPNQGPWGFLVEELATDMAHQDPFPDTRALAACLHLAEGGGWGHVSKEDCAEMADEWETGLGEEPDDRDWFGQPIADWVRESKRPTRTSSASGSEDRQTRTEALGHKRR